MNGHSVMVSILVVLRDLLLNPLLYAGFILAYWDLRRTSTLERTLFGFRSTRAFRQTLVRGLQGLAAGIILSVLFVALGLQVSLWEVATLTMVNILLAALRLRWLSPVYALAIVVTGARILARWTPGMSGQLGAWIGHIASLSVWNWFLIMAGVLLAEAALLFLDKDKHHAPAVAVSKRGRGIGALWVKIAFALPLVIPTEGTLWNAPAYAHATNWHILWLAGLPSFGLLAMPVLAGFSGLFSTLHPRQGLRQVIWVDVLSAALLVAAALVMHRSTIPGLWLMAWVVVLLREASTRVLSWRQGLHDPLFAPDEDGVMVLKVLPGTLAAHMGIQSGERIMEVNAMPVRSPYDVHFGLNQNPAYAKLLVRDLRGEARLAGHTVYEGERVQLGLVFAPDGFANRGIERTSFGLLESLYARTIRLDGAPRSEDPVAEPASQPTGGGTLSLDEIAAAMDAKGQVPKGRPEKGQSEKSRGE